MVVPGALKWSIVKRQQSLVCFPDLLSTHAPGPRSWPEIVRIQRPTPAYSERERPRFSLRNDPTLERPFTCDRCHRSYLRNAHLHRHQKYECGKEPQFQCPFCNKRCKIKSNLTQHIITHFPKNDVFKIKK
ncbi:hypothetical protein J6590_002387 [Homalodisca vitripennis]|nr:hypothetical protein J6590_002387 [Homalodisca vitripennis]